MAEWLMCNQVTATLKCGYCNMPIGNGEPYALVGLHKSKRCQECMRTRQNEEPPAAVFSAAPPLDVTPQPGRQPEFVSLDTIAARVRRRIHTRDFFANRSGRDRQAGGDE